MCIIVFSSSLGMGTAKQQQPTAGNRQLISGYSSLWPAGQLSKEGGWGLQSPQDFPQSSWIIYTNLKHVCLSEAFFINVVIPLLTNEDVIAVYSLCSKALSPLKEGERNRHNWPRLTSESPTGAFAWQKTIQIFEQTNMHWKLLFLSRSPSL